MRAIDPTGKLELWAKGLEDAINNAARQVNAQPVGNMTAPPKISALNVSSTASGFHSLQIVDNEPPQGTVYHIESSLTPDFSDPQPVVSNTPYRNHTVFQGAGGFHYRAYSSFVNGPASPPVYFGGEASPTLVESPGSTVTPGPEPLPSTGSGSGSSQLPQGATGFGANPGSDFGSGGNKGNLL